MSDYIQPREGAPAPLAPTAVAPAHEVPAEAKALLRFFESAHLPKHLAEVSAPCGDLARLMAAKLGGFELVAGLRSLLIAKDAFVRARLEFASPPPKS